MVEAQRLRDAALADAVLRARNATGGKSVVLITGNGHARRDRAVPFYLKGYDLDIVTVAMRESVPGEVDAQSYLADQPYDFIWITPPAAREDPCKAFKK